MGTLLVMVTLATIATASPSPSPTATPLKTIVDVQSRAACAATIQAAAHAIPALLTNDMTFASIGRTVAKILADKTSHASDEAVELDQLHEEGLIDSVARNTKSALDALANVPADSALASGIRDVADAQTTQANHTRSELPMRRESRSRARAHQPTKAAYRILNAPHMIRSTTAA
jgi:hypothetical protein